MITPSQIREKNLSTVQSGGYDKEEVNALLAQIVESYQAVYDENKRALPQNGNTCRQD